MWRWRMDTSHEDEWKQDVKLYLNMLFNEQTCSPVVLPYNINMARVHSITACI